MSRVTAVLGLVAAMGGRAGLARAAAAPIAAPAGGYAVVTVEAGELDRKNTPVTFELPAELAGTAGGGPLELRDPGGRRLPLQVNGNHGHFVLPALAHGKQATFQMVDARDGKAAAKAGGQVDLRQESDSVVASIGGAPVFHFRTRAPAPSTEVPVQFTRAGYLHPVWSPRGVMVTDDSPADHRHHHGIWTAWTAAEIAGHHLSFWGPEPGRSRNDLVAVADLWSGKVAGGFSARLASTDLSVTPARPVLDSEWKVVVHRSQGAPGERRAPYFAFDLEWTDRVVGDKALLLPEHRYGGLGVRGNREWIAPGKTTCLTSEGKDRLAGDNTRVRWVHIGGPVGGKVAGLAILVHPANLRAPEPVRLNPGIPELCLSAPKAGPLTIEPGKPYVARYRFVIADGKANPALLERLWRDYARAPVVKVAVAPASARRS